MTTVGCTHERTPIDQYLTIYREYNVLKPIIVIDVFRYVLNVTLYALAHLYMRDCPNL